MPGPGTSYHQEVATVATPAIAYPNKESPHVPPSRRLRAAPARGAACQEGPMRYLMLVRAAPAAGAGNLPSDAQLAALARYHGELARAGVLLDASGLRCGEHGWRIRCHAGQREVVDGLVGGGELPVVGYTLIQVRSREEAMEWARRCPLPFGPLGEGEIEVRPLLDAANFAPAATQVQTVSAPGMPHSRGPGA